MAAAEQLQRLIRGESAHDVEIESKLLIKTPRRLPLSEAPPSAQACRLQGILS